MKYKCQKWHPNKKIGVLLLLSFIKHCWHSKRQKAAFILLELGFKMQKDAFKMPKGVLKIPETALKFYELDPWSLLSLPFNQTLERLKGKQS